MKKGIFFLGTALATSEVGIDGQAFGEKEVLSANMLKQFVRNLISP